jgi:hypothetical protein
MLGQR